MDIWFDISLNDWLTAKTPALREKKLLNNRQRFVFFHDLVAHLAPEKAKGLDNPPDLGDALAHVKIRFDAGCCVKLIANETAAIRILDYREIREKNAVALLFGFADSNGADPAFMNIYTGASKVVQKGIDNGNAFSAHCIIFCDKLTETVPIYKMLLEKVPGATRSVIMGFLNNELREASKFSLPRKGKKPLKCWLAVDCVGHQSEKLKRELDGGFLKEVEFISYQYADNGLDRIGNIKNRTQKILIKAGPNVASGDEALSWLNKINSWGRKNGFSEARVVYKSEAGKQQTIDVPTIKTDVGDFNITRHEVITVENEIAQFENIIRDDIIHKMLSL